MPKPITPTVKKNIRSVLISSCGGIFLHDVEKDYRSLLLEKLNYRKYGFPTLLDFLYAMPDIAKLEWFPANNAYKIFAVADSSFYLPTFLERNTFMSTNTGAVMMPPVPQIVRDEWEETLMPNLLGLYAVCFHNRNKEIREIITEDFSSVGEVVEVSFLKDLVYVRFNTRAEALASLEKFYMKYNAQPAHERSAPRQLIKKRESQKPQRRLDSQLVEVYVGNLAVDVTEDEVLACVGGQVLQVKDCLKDNRRYMFLIVKEGYATDVINGLNNKQIRGKRAIAQLANSYKLNPNNNNHQVIHPKEPIASKVIEGRMGVLNDLNYEQPYLTDSHENYALGSAMLHDEENLTPKLEPVLPKLKPARPSTQPAIKSGQLGKRSAQQERHSVQTAMPGLEPAMPDIKLESAMPGLESVMPGLEYAMPGLKSAMPALEPVMPGLELAMPGLEPAMPGLELAMPGLEPAMPGLEPTMPGLEPAMPGLEPAMPGLEPAMPGLERVVPHQKSAFNGSEYIRARKMPVAACASLTAASIGKQHSLSRPTQHSGIQNQHMQMQHNIHQNQKHLESRSNKYQKQAPQGISALPPTPPTVNSANQCTSEMSSDSHQNNTRHILQLSSPRDSYKVMKQKERARVVKHLLPSIQPGAAVVHLSSFDSETHWQTLMEFFSELKPLTIKMDTTVELPKTHAVMLLRSDFLANAALRYDHTMLGGRKINVHYHPTDCEEEVPASISVNIMNSDHASNRTCSVNLGDDGYNDEQGMEEDSEQAMEQDFDMTEEWLMIQVVRAVRRCCPFCVVWKPAELSTTSICIAVTGIIDETHLWGQVIDKNTTEDHKWLVDSYAAMQTPENHITYTDGSLTCAALYEGEWFRGCVENVDQGMATVFAIDYGTVVSQPVNRLRNFPTKFWKTTAQVWPIRVNSCVFENLQSVDQIKVQAEVLNPDSLNLPLVVNITS